MFKFVMQALFGAMILSAVMPVRASTLEVDSGLNLWLRADNVTVLSGNTVDSWQDLTATGSGIGDDTSQDASLSDGGPSRNTGVLNGRPVVNFGGQGAYEFTGSLGLSGAQDFTSFVVARHNNTPASNATARVLQFGAITAHNGGESVGIDIGTPGFRYNNGNRLFDNDDFSTTKFGVGSWVMSSPHTYVSGEFALDGVAGTQTSATNGSNTINLQDQGYTLGKGIALDGSNNNLINAQVAEVLLFDRVLTQREYEQVGFYLVHRYDLDAQFTQAPSVFEHSLSNINLGPAPASVDTDVHESNVDAFLFLEQENLELTSDIDVNIVSAGSYTNGFQSVAGQVAAGTHVDTYYLSFDPVDDSGTAYTVDVSLEFSTEVLGIITGNGDLIATHGSLGSGLTTYNTDNLGLDDNNVDEVIWNPDNRTLDITLRVAGSNLDQIRILVATIPEPGSASLLAVLGTLLMRRRNGSTVR
ncbi:hypothetical protein HED60_24090 [Planctomycetales bacterium ZRK34]|nr:hypothetical protein HED60_24090 [Planctomycetales bacterium ZRK34]